MTINREISVGNIITIGLLLVTIITYGVKLEARQDATEDRLSGHIVAANNIHDRLVPIAVDNEWRARVLAELERMRKDIDEIKRVMR